MSESIVSYDPGETTGWSQWEMPDDLPVQRLDYGLIHGGREGFMRLGGVMLAALKPSLVICEKFNESDGRLAKADLTPLWIEGSVATICDALGIPILWSETSQKALCTDATLKEFGLYIENSEARINPAINWEDARDVNDSQIHVLATAKSWDHEPTIAVYWPDR